MVIKIDEIISVELIAPKHAAALLFAVNTNRNYLNTWLLWVDNMQTVEDFKNWVLFRKVLCTRQNFYILTLSICIFMSF